MIPKIWRLSESTGDDNLGLACTERGLMLGRTPLIEWRDGRFEVREQSEPNVCSASLTGGDRAAADARLATVASALTPTIKPWRGRGIAHSRLPDRARAYHGAMDVGIKYAPTKAAVIGIGAASAHRHRPIRLVCASRRCRQQITFIADGAKRRSHSVRMLHQAPATTGSSCGPDHIDELADFIVDRN